MAYVCDIDQMGAARRTGATPTGVAAKIGNVLARAVNWVVAWNEAADEAAAARSTYGMCGGKLTDGLERDMMRRLLRTE